MICGKSLSSEDVLEKIKSHNPFGFSKDLKREIIPVFFFKILLCRISSQKRTKTKQNKSLLQ